MKDVQRFELAPGQRFGFALLALFAVAIVVGGIATANGIAIGTGVVIGLLAAYIGRQAFGPTQAYLIDGESLRHVRGDELLLEVEWTQVTSLGVVDLQRGRGRLDQLAIDVHDLGEVIGGHRYRNTRKLTKRDIMLNLAPLEAPAEEVAEAARAAWLKATA